MNTRRKPQAGACRVCGCAVVQPTPSSFARAEKADRTGRFWVSGHLYEHDDAARIIRLRDVTCAMHAYDYDGGDTRFDWEGLRVRNGHAGH